MSKIELNYLVFDDDPDTERQNLNKINMPGCNVNSICINPIDSFDAESNSFNSDKFKEEILLKTRGRNINLIITDWNILPDNDGFAGVVGWDIIEEVLEVKEKWKSRPFLIYSANIKKASSYILEKIKNEIGSNPDDIIPSLNFISKMLKLQIRFHERNKERFDEIKTLLKDSNTISNMVLDSILSFDQNMIINTGNKNYDGKILSEILNVNHIDNGSLKFIREFIELSISHYSKINE